MIPPHLCHQIYLSFLEQNYCTPPKCVALSEYTDSAHTEVEDLSSRYMNGSNVFSCAGGAARSSEVERSLMVRWVVGSILHGVDPLSYFSFQPVLHDWCNKGHGMCYTVCGMVHIKEPLLLIDKNSPLSLSNWSFTIYPTPYNHKIKCVECIIK